MFEIYQDDLITKITVARQLKPKYKVFKHLQKILKVELIYTHVSMESLQQIKSTFDNV